MSIATEASPGARAPVKRSRRAKKLPIAEKPAASGETTPTSGAGLHTGAEAEPVLVEKELLRELSKRLKKSTKKLESIAKSEDKIKDLDEAAKATTTLINKDERKKISDKPITQAIHKELQEVFDKLKEDLEYEERRVAKDLKKQQQQHEAALEAAVRAAREEGMRTERAETENKNNSQLLSLVKFLRLAGYRRTEKSDNPDEDQAIEDVLVLVYSGDQTAMSACTKLAAGTSDIVSEAAPGVTYARVKELAYDLRVPEEIYATEEARIEQDTVTTQLPVDEVPCITNPSLVPDESPSDEVTTITEALPNDVEEASIVAIVPPNATPSEPVAEKSEQQVHVTNEVAATPNIQPPALAEIKNGGKNNEFQNVESKRGGRGRGGRGYRGGRAHRGDRGESRGEHRGEKSEHMNGEKGEHRIDRGENRGENRGDHRGGRGGRGYRHRRGNSHRGNSENSKSTPSQAAGASGVTA